jgi:hypothetical protein
MPKDTNESIDRATLAVLALYGPQKVSDARAFEYAVLVGAGFATFSNSGMSERRYDINAAGARHLDATRPAERSTLEHRLEVAQRNGNVRDRQAAKAELDEFDRDAAAKRARAEAGSGMALAL